MRRRAVFGTVLASTMGASTFMLVVFGVLASDLLAEFSVERWQVGVLVTAAALLGAVISPVIGRVVDRAGARRSTIATLVLAAGALAAVGLAPSYPLLVVAAAATALAQASANPATNKLIAEQVAPGSRGVITGIKQSGVQFGVFAGGLALPPLAALAGWRVAVLVFAVVFTGLAVLAGMTLPPDRLAASTPVPAAAVLAADGPSATTSRAGAFEGDGDVASSGPSDVTRAPLPPIITRLAVYGFLLGAGGSTIFTYLPLYAEEALGFSSTSAGRAVALTGLVGIGARIAWGRAAELRIGSLPALRIIAALAVLAGLVLLAAGTEPRLVWLAAITTGLSASAWNAVGMLAIIQQLPSADTGRGSGVVMFGFLAGLGIGAPAFGWSVDAFGTYGPGWLAASLVFATALPLVGRRAQARG